MSIEKRGQLNVLEVARRHGIPAPKAREIAEALAQERGWQMEKGAEEAATQEACTRAHIRLRSPAIGRIPYHVPQLFLTPASRAYRRVSAPLRGLAPDPVELGLVELRDPRA
jgi:hypothetical protein